ncbi:IclR family transcriptional regulator [Mycobacterium hubeiense]|uniref:IclR family transcriptional regulator n=1 Tax=Mycobacterium hubeiense TaxID=1867256 RepID=UPI000C7EFBD9|nr:IclR family transcriptional regulator [Mycobacterium sp. QGD 101]
MQRSSSGKRDATTSLVDRVAQIMNLFDSPGTLLYLDEVVARTGLPRSSTHRILNQLHDAGLLHHRPDGYCVASSPLPLTRMVDHSQLRGVAAPTLERLHADTALVVHLGVLVGADVVYLDKVSSGQGVVVPTRVGGHTPAHASALGKAMLSQIPAESVDAIVADPLRKCTPATIADLSMLHQELAQIRSRHGLAYDNEELTVGLSSVAAPIRTADGEGAGLSLTGAVPVGHLQNTAPFVLRAARDISERLGRIATRSAPGPAEPPSVTDDMLSRVLRTLSSDDWV